MKTTNPLKIDSQEVFISDGINRLNARVNVVPSTKSWVIFTHGSGSSHNSIRNKWISKHFNENGISTLLFDLLSKEEDVCYRNRFHIPLMAERLITATQWLINSEYYKNSSGKEIGYFGGSTGAGVILEAAEKLENEFPINQIISRGGRADLVSSETLSKIKTPVLFIAGENDPQIVKLNKMAMEYLENTQIEIIPYATHLFTEPGALDEVARISLEALERRNGFINRVKNNLSEVFSN